MSEDAATVEFAKDIVKLGDKIAELTLKQAKELSDYLKDAYDIEPAAGGGVMMAAPGGGDGGGEAAAAIPGDRQGELLWERIKQLHSQRDNRRVNLVE